MGRSREYEKRAQHTGYLQRFDLNPDSLPAQTHKRYCHKHSTGWGFHTLSIDSEGVDVAKWLNERDVTAFVLKYRLAHSFTNDPVAELLPKMANFKKLDKENAPVIPLSIDDDKRFVEYVRQHAKEIGIAPKRIDFMGFSAGDTVTMGVGLDYNAANRPDFLVPIYSYLSEMAIAKQVVPADAPPLFVCATSDELVLGDTPADLTQPFYKVMLV